MSGNFSIQGPFILLGDLHFGIKQHSIEFFRNSQLKFFTEQLIPFMKENNIKTIVQLGDFLDNRTVLDTRLWDVIYKELLDVLLKEDIHVLTLLGNHDIAYKNTRSTSFMYSIERMYNNIHLIDESCIIDINNTPCLFQPWLCPGDVIKTEDLLNVNYVFGHFEIINFEMSKGHFNEVGLETKNFKLKNIKQVFTGHFHIQQKKGKIHYIGTPYQLNYNDYKLKNGFYVINKDFKMQYHENEVSHRFIKLKYNDTNKKPLVVSGLKKEYNCDTSNIPYNLIKGNTVKFYVNKAKDSKFEEYIYLLTQNGIEFEVINNQEISNLIGTDYLNNDIPEEDTRSFIIDSVKAQDDISAAAILLLMNVLKEAEELE